MTPAADLETLRSHIADRLVAAARTRRGAWRTPVLSTLDLRGGPSARTIVMRSVDPAARRLEIFTDARSAKIDQVAADPRVTLTFWDPIDAEQLRVDGTATLVADSAVVEARWQSIGPRGHSVYGESGRDVFRVLTVDWTAWDWLWIGDIAHRRARFDWHPNGGVDASWLDA